LAPGSVPWQPGVREHVKALSGFLFSCRRRSSMFGSAILDVTIGLILLYLLFSLVCSAFRELVELITKTRAKDLERGMQALLKDPNFVKAVYNHPMIY